jgi:sec-independent protein translocase protein TatA
MLSPLQFGIPAGPELLVILLVMLLIFGLPALLVLVFGVGYFRSKSSGSGDRVAELEARVEELERERGSGDERREE